MATAVAATRCQYTGVCLLGGGEGGLATESLPTGRRGVCLLGVGGLNGDPTVDR